MSKQKRVPIHISCSAHFKDLAVFADSIQKDDRPKGAKHCGASVIWNDPVRGETLSFQCDKEGESEISRFPRHRLCDVHAEKALLAVQMEDRMFGITPDGFGNIDKKLLISCKLSNIHLLDKLTEKSEYAAEYVSFRGVLNFLFMPDLQAEQGPIPEFDNALFLSLADLEIAKVAMSERLSKWKDAKP